MSCIHRRPLVTQASSRVPLRLRNSRTIAAFSPPYACIARCGRGLGHLVCTWPDVALVPVQPHKALRSTGNASINRALSMEAGEPPNYTSCVGARASTLWQIRRLELPSAAPRVRLWTNSSVDSPGLGLSARRNRVILLCTATISSNKVESTAHLAAWKLRIAFVARVERFMRLRFGTAWRNSANTPATTFACMRSSRGDLFPNSPRPGPTRATLALFQNLLRLSSGGGRGGDFPAAPVQMEIPSSNNASNSPYSPCRSPLSNSRPYVVDICTRHESGLRSDVKGAPSQFRHDFG